MSSKNEILNLNQTYIGKYSCEKQYHELKDCMRNAEPSKMNYKCD